MFRKTALLAIVMCVTTVALADTDPCPCIVLGYTWMATPCETWNCAASALVLANGDAHTMVLPMTDDHVKWVVLRRVVSGSATVSPDNPLLIERFGNMLDGSVRFSALDHNSSPLLVTATGGNVLVVYLKPKGDAGKYHAVSH